MCSEIFPNEGHLSLFKTHAKEIIRTLVNGSRKMKLIGNTFSIRPVQSSDSAQVLDVYRQCEDFLALGPEPHASMEMIEEDLQISKAAGGFFCGIFDSDQRMIGVLDFIPRNFEGHPSHAFIELLMIAKFARRQGLGRQIMQVVETEILGDANITEILSAVQVNNPSAIQFWENIGYKIVSSPILNADGTTAFRLRKIIRAEP